METWSPIELGELEALIEKGVNNMTENEKIVWKLISVKPQKWIEPEFGEEGNGFWVVAIMGFKVIWYNDIEEGFNISSYTKLGEIDCYGAEQDELQWTLNKLITDATKSQSGF